MAATYATAALLAQMTDDDQALLIFFGLSGFFLLLQLAYALGGYVGRKQERLAAVRSGAGEYVVDPETGKSQFRYIGSPMEDV